MPASGSCSTARRRVIAPAHASASINFIGAAAKLPRVIHWPLLILSAAGFVLLVASWRNLFGLKLAP
ncbi:MAG TPA: hypothetical protein VMR00_10030 [Streptosporangiaceae bacterium]|jgi:hypothetical protein|nr:hypothetical protein [Streptosporangiaceae bacterium]